MLKNVLSMGSHFNTAIQEPAEAGRNSEPHEATHCSSGVSWCLELQLQSLNVVTDSLYPSKGKEKEWKDRARVIVYIPSDVQGGMKEC